MSLSDGMMVFNLDGKDWVVEDLIASFSDYSGPGGGEVISLLGSVQVGVDIYKSVSVSIKDIQNISEKDYPFIAGEGSGTWIEINEGKTVDSGILYYSINPDNNISAKGNLTISIFDTTGEKLSGNFSGEIYKANYPGNQNGQWTKTTIKSGRFQNIPLIIGK